MDRNVNVDIAKGIAMIMIIDVHLQSGSVFVIGETFHVAAFFIISGFLWSVNESKNVKSVNKFISCNYLKKKSNSLLKPYLSWGIGMLLFTFFIHIIIGSDDIKQTMLIKVAKFISFQGIGTLWFLPVLFVSNIIFFMLPSNKIYKILFSLGLFLLGVITSYILTNSGYTTNKLDIYQSTRFVSQGIVVLILTSLIGTGFMALGFAIKNIFSVQKKNIRFSIPILLLMVSLLSLMLWLMHPNFNADIHKAIIPNPIFFILSSFVGAMLLFLLTITFSKIAFSSRILSFIGSNSLFIMATHKDFYITAFLYFFIGKIFSIVSIQNNGLLSCCTLFMVLIIEYILIYIKKMYFHIFSHG